MIRSFLIWVFFLVSAEFLIAQKCPIKLLNINILTKKELQQDYQVCINSDSMQLRVAGDTITFINNFHGSLGDCIFPIIYLDYGKSKKDYFIRISYFKILKNENAYVSFEMRYQKLNRITYRFIGDELTSPVFIDKQKILGLFDKRQLQSFKL
jgi:hypothetical protein